VRETDLGGNEAAGLRPLRATCGCADAGIVSRASPALPSWEARIELLSRAGPRGVFRVNWALPAPPSRANKHRNLQISRLGWE
jgi:hypothetical protein